MRCCAISDASARFARIDFQKAKLAHLASCYIPCLSGETEGQLLLQRQVPVDDVVAARVLFDVDAVARHGGEVDPVERRFREVAWQEIADRGADVERRALRHLGREDPRQRQRIVDADAAANGRPAVAAGIVGQSDARLEIAERRVGVEHLVDVDDRAGVQIQYLGQQVVRLDGDGTHFVAKAEVHRELVAAPAVVEIPRDDVGPDAGLLRTRGIEREEVRRPIGQQGRERSEVEQAVLPPEAGFFVLNPLEGEPEPERMIASRHVGVVVDLERIGEITQFL